MLIRMQETLLGETKKTDLKKKTNIKDKLGLKER